MGGHPALGPGEVHEAQQGRAARAARRRVPVALPREARRGPSPHHVRPTTSRRRSSTCARSLRTRRHQPRGRAVEGGLLSALRSPRHARPDRLVARRRRGPPSPAAVEPRRSCCPPSCIHGGAGGPVRDEEAYHDTRFAAAEAGWAVLSSGGSTLDAVQAAAVELEDDPLFQRPGARWSTRTARSSTNAALMCGASGALGVSRAFAGSAIRLARTVAHTARPARRRRGRGTG